MAAVLKSGQTTREWVAAINRGLPVRAAMELKSLLGIGNDALAGLLGVSGRTVARMDPGHGRLDAVAGDRLFRVSRIVALAVDVLEDEAAAVRWMKSSQRALGDAIPLELVGTDVGARAVEALLGRMEFGVYT